MSDFERSPASRALDEVVSEAQTHLDAPHNRKGEEAWSALEARVMAAALEERPAVVADVAASSRRAGILRGAALGLALAAAFALFVRSERSDERATLDANPASATSARGEVASALRSADGAELRVDGVAAAPGATLHAGSALEVARGRATFERPRKVTWLLEPAAEGGKAEARITAAAEPLVVSLGAGAIEAQVAPVATGEAFAVDIATGSGLVRVAVHGTHLRVERVGDKVVVDLTEGVVSIGVPPRTGNTYGTLVNAPAHVELDAPHLGSIRVVHDPKAVRAAIPLAPLAPHEPSPVAARTDPAPPPHPAPSAAPRPPHAAEPPVKPDAPKPAHARDAITAAIRDCAAASRRSGSVQVTATSTLRLQVSASGAVESAQFTPPLSPEIQTCAAQTIYRTKLDETGVVTIPVEFSF